MRIKVILYLLVILLSIVVVLTYRNMQNVKAAVGDRCASSSEVILTAHLQESVTTPNGEAITKVYAQHASGECFSTDVNGQFGPVISDQGERCFFTQSIGTSTGVVFSAQCPTDHVEFVYATNGTSPTDTPMPTATVTPQPTYQPTTAPTKTPKPTATPAPTTSPCEDVEECPQPTQTPQPTETPTPGPTNPPLEPPHDNPPVCNDPKPATNVLLSVNRINSTSAQLNWTKVSGASTYSIFYGPSKDNYPFGVSSTGDTDNFTISNLDPNSNYCFRVRVVQGCNSSDLSNEICLSGQVLAAKQGEVLGVSTLAATGDPLGNLATAGQILSFMLIFAGLYGQKQKRLQKILKS